MNALNNRWMIRKETGEIKGPVTENELKELIKGQRIGANDEVCNHSGNWFFLREKDQVQKYLPFFNSQRSTTHEQDEVQEEKELSAEDLEYPDESEEDQVQELARENLKEHLQEPSPTSDGQHRATGAVPPKDWGMANKEKKSHLFLFAILFVLLLLLFALLYTQKRSINQFLNSITSTVTLPKAYALLGPVQLGEKKKVPSHIEKENLFFEDDQILLFQSPTGISWKLKKQTYSDKSSPKEFFLHILQSITNTNLLKTYSEKLPLTKPLIPKKNSTDFEVNLEDFLRQLETIEKEKTRKQIQRAISLLKKGPFRSLMKLLLYQKVMEPKALMTYSQRVLFWDHIRFNFDFSLITFHPQIENLNKRISDYQRELIVKIVENKEDFEEMGFYLIHYLKKIFPLEESQLSLFPLSEYESLAFSPTRGILFPSVWIYYFHDETKDYSSLSRFVKKVVKVKLPLSLKEKFYWVNQYGHGTRPNSTIATNKRSNEEKNYFKYINSVWDKKVSIQSIGGTVTHDRSADLFHQMIKDGQNIHFALFGLYKINELNWDDLAWFLHYLLTNQDFGPTPPTQSGG